MPLYAIKTKGSDKLRLIDATSESAALKHAAAGMFTARRITKPTEVGALVKAGATIETAGEVAAHPDDKTGTERVNAETGMVERYKDDGVTSDDVRPATLAELAEADGGTYRVNATAGMVQRHVGNGADDNDSNWADLREATPEEIAEVKSAGGKRGGK